MKLFRLAIAVLILPAFILAACAPTPAATLIPTTTSIPPTQTLQPTSSSTPTTSPTPPATPTPEPSPTPEAPADLHNMETWPQEMRAYWMGGNQEWTDQALTAEFDAFIQQARRDFLTQNGVENAASLSDLEAFYQYLRIETEQKNMIMQFTITELQTMNQDALNIHTAHFAYYEETQPRITHDGIWADPPGGGIKTKAWYDQWVGNPNSHLRSDNLTAESVIRNIFGSNQAEMLDRYDGIIGDAAAVFRLPGIDPEQAVGILVHTSVGSDHNWLPLIVHFQDLILAPGSMIVNGMHEIVEVTSPTSIPASHTTFDPAPGADNLTLASTMQLVGQKVHCGTDYRNGIFAYFPYGFGLQGANSEIHVLNPDNAPGTYSGAPEWPWNP